MPLRKKKNITEEQVLPNTARSEKCRELLRLKDIMNELLSRKEFIAKSEYLSLIPNYSRVVEYFTVLIDR